MLVVLYSKGVFLERISFVRVDLKALRFIIQLLGYLYISYHVSRNLHFANKLAYENVHIVNGERLFKTNIFQGMTLVF